MYQRFCEIAVDQTIVQRAGRESVFHNLRKRLQIDYQQLKRCLDQSLHNQYRQRLENMHSYLNLLKSHRSCLCYLLRALEKFLSCSYTIYDVCVRIFGSTNPEARNTFVLSYCLLYRQSNRESDIVLMPATAGARLLSIDRGGIRGVILLVFLQYLQASFNELEVPLRDLFDFVSRTLAGMIDTP